MSDTVMVPDEAERELVLSGLAELLESDSDMSFVRGAIVLPDERFFPDKWAGGTPSVARLTRRLLHYAGLDEFEVDVTVYDEESSGKPGVTSRGPGNGVWYDGTVAQVCRFSVDAAAMREPKPLVAGLARAVTEAWLDKRGKLPANGSDADARLERERRIDLATFVLGFGVLTTDASIMHHARAAGGFRATRSQTKLGVSSPQHMAFTLAVQAACRDGSRVETRSWLGHLQANQAAFFRASAKQIVASYPDLRERLGIPAPETWPPPRRLDLSARDLEGEGQGEEPPEERKDEDRGIRGKNVGKPVFRVERTLAPRIARVMLFGTLVLGGLASRGFPGVEISMPHVIVGGLALGLLGLVVGRFFQDVRCSEPKCGAPLGPEDVDCPSCGGTIRGAIKHPRERLAAEEALSRSAKGEIASPED